MPAACALLAAALLAAPAADAAPAGEAPPRFVTYELVESWKNVTPAGERTVSAGGIVAVRGRGARWDLAHGAFPRSTASSAIVSGGDVTLLDRQNKVAAGATPADFASLFQGRPSEPGAASHAVRNVKVAVRPDGGGRPFEGRETKRFRLEAAWSLVLSAPGRITRVKTEVSGTVEAAALPEARSAFDAVDRLLPARGPAREALETELAKVDGLPVFVEILVTSTSSVEAPGIPSGSEPPPKPLTARSTVTRRVKNLAVREGREGDEALVSVPDDFHTRSLDRLLVGREIP